MQVDGYVRSEIHQVVVPTEDEIEIRDGQRKTVVSSKKLLPRLRVSSQMLMDDDVLVRGAEHAGRDRLCWHDDGQAGEAHTAAQDTEVEQILKQMTTRRRRASTSGSKVGETRAGHGWRPGSAIMIGTVRLRSTSIVGVYV